MTDINQHENASQENTQQETARPHRLPVGNSLVPYGTPYHATQVLLVVLKQIFAAFPEGHPYRFVPDDFDATGIVFDMAYNKASGIHGKKPIVTVARGNQSAGVAMLRDLGAKQLPTSFKNASNLVESSADIRVISRLRAECEIVAETVFAHLLMLRTMLPALCGVHMVSGISMSPARPFEQDDVSYEVDISMPYSMQYLWTRLPIGLDVLRGITAHFEHKDQARFGQSLNNTLPNL